MHEMQSNDGLVLTQRRAWHGLGVVVEDAPTPHEGLKIAGLDWRTEVAPLTGLFGTDPSTAERAPVTTHVCNYRSDDKSQLGVVSSNFKAIQNSDMADFADALSTTGDAVQLETAGSIKGGRKVYMLLRGESFSVGRDDEVKPYYLLANAHDGSMSFRALPTTIRVVCSNTLHAALGRKGKGGITIRHTSKAMDRVVEAKRALNLYQSQQEEQRKQIETLAGRNVSVKDVQDFWLESYQRDFGAIPARPANDKEVSIRERALTAVNQMANRFDRERDKAGSSAWNAFNAYSGWVQHDRKTRSADRTENNLFGASTRFTSQAFDRALTSLAV